MIRVRIHRRAAFLDWWPLFPHVQVFFNFVVVFFSNFPASIYFNYATLGSPTGGTKLSNDVTHISSFYHENESRPLLTLWLKPYDFCPGTATIYARYKYVEKLSEQNSLVKPSLNKATLWLGIIACFGMCIVATFQVFFSLHVTIGCILISHNFNVMCNCIFFNLATCRKQLWR